MTHLPIKAVVASVVAWELFFFLSSAVLARLCRRQGVVAIAAEDEREKATKKLAELGPSYVCAFAHACLVGIRGVQHVSDMIGATVTVQLALPGAADPMYGAAFGITRTNVIFLSWLIYDLSHVVRTYPKLGGADTVAHHLGFIAASIICGHYGILLLQFSWLICGELSSIALNVRWALLTTGRGESAMLQVTNKIFALTFFVTRVLVYGLGLANLLSNRAKLFSLDGVPPPLVMLVVVLLIGGFGLNLMWMSKIFGMALGSKRGKKRQ